MTAEEHYRAGVLCVSSGDLEGAVSAFRQALSVDASFHMAHLGWAQVLDRKGQVDAAIFQVRDAIALAPDEPLAHASLSRLYQQKGMIQDAEAAMADSLKLQKG